MTYKATLKVQFDTEWTSTGGIYDDEALPEEHYTFEIPAEDINSIQLFRFFSNIARTMGHTEDGIMKGACALAFNDMRSEEDMRKIADEFELKLVEDYRDEVCKLEAEVRDLKAKLSRALDPENPNYTDEEVEAMTEEILQEALKPTVNTLKNADVVCFDCGKKYGEYHDGVSSVWEGKCNVCGKTKRITEVRDFGYLQKGIRELVK